jgi:DNA-binding transcriptional LysR family regulator
MARALAPEHQAGRRLRFRDLQVFLAVVECGSMAKAAAQLGVTQPGVSEIIAGLEDAFGARLFDRSPQGVETTHCGRALLHRARTVLDELKQGAKDIAFLSDPTVGDLRIGCPESIACAFLPTVIESFYRVYPGISLHVDQVTTPALDQPELRARKLDFVLTRLVKPNAGDPPDNDLNVEILLNDEVVVAAGVRSRWARRRKINLSELVDAPWILTPVGSLNTELVVEAFLSNKLKVPKIALTTFSVHLRTHLLSTSEFVAAMPRSVLHLNAKQFGLKALPVKLPVRSFPVAVVTLRNRALSPVAELFLDHLRALTRSMAMKG